MPTGGSATVNTPTAFLEWLSTDAVVWKTLPVGDAADAALDRRDERETEQAWLREDDAVQQLLQATPMPSDTTEILEAIAERSFIKAFEIAEHHELAAQVSDDLRLLAEAAAVGYQSPTLDRLWEAYSSGSFRTAYDRRGEVQDGRPCRGLAHTARHE